MALLRSISVLKEVVKANWKWSLLSIYIFVCHNKHFDTVCAAKTVATRELCDKVLTKSRNYQVQQSKTKQCIIIFSVKCQTFPHSLKRNCEQTVITYI